MPPAQSSEDATVDAALLLDRFVSASSGEDAVQSLERIETALVQGTLLPLDLVQDVDVMIALVSVLGTGSYQATLLSVENGPALVARIYLALLKNTTGNSSNSSSSVVVARTLLTSPEEGRFLEAAIDVAADANNSSYPRVLALQVLRAVTQRRDLTKWTQSQWLQAPSGLHRIADLLNDTNDEQVRNEAILLAAALAEWAAVAKIWMFSEVADVVVQSAVAQGGLTRGPVTVLDCLRLVHALVQHADAALADLVVSSPTLVPNLARLLDLRGGLLFLQPPTAAAAATTSTTLAALSKDDDLDDLIASSSGGGGGAGAGAGASKEDKIIEPPIPWLTPSEEDIIQTVLDILATVMENEKVKQSIWKQHAGLCSLLWEMALLTAPPPGRPYPCAVPSIRLQQRGLEIIARYFDSPSIMDRHSGLDRLFYLVCTGARGVTLDEKLAVSQAALFVIRRTVTDATANEMLLSLLAPPMGDDTDEGAAPVSPTAQVVPKLLSTAREQLRAPVSAEQTKGDVIMRKVMLSGSLGALGVLLTDEPRRSILLRLTNTSHNDTAPSLVDAILGCLVNEYSNSDVGMKDDFIPMQLLRFLGQWLTDSPQAVQAVLSSSYAMGLSSLFQQSQSMSVSTLAGLVLGLCMEYITDESQCGGWTRAAILALIQQHSGVARFTTQLESLKTVITLSPWSSCVYEWHIWQQWYESSVLVVRKRVVYELTAGGGASADDDDAGDETSGEVTTVDRKGLKAMQLLMAEQAIEMDALRTALAESQRLVSSQDKQLTTWKQRAESNPTQLDEMLTDSTSKNSELEEKLQSLETEMRSISVKHESELRDRDEVIATVRQELVEVRAQETDACQQRDIIRDEMMALSQAYASLEDEFQRLTAVGSVERTTEELAGNREGSEDRSQQQQQPEGEESHQAPSDTSLGQVGSTEVATLRAENSRMRDEARSADEWMTMAVERMNASAVEAATLQQEITSLRAQLDQFTTSLQASGDETVQRLTQETEIRMNLTNELSQRELAFASIQDQNEQLRIQIRDLSSEVTAKSDTAEEIKIDRERLKSEVQALSHQLTIQQDDLAQREARIQELESLPSQAHGDSTIEWAMSSQEELVQLREAIDASQDWIGKAVEHHQALTDEKESLFKTNLELSARIEDFEAKALLSMDVEGDTVSRLESELGEQRMEIRRLNDIISQQQEQLQIRLDAAEKLEHSLFEMRADMDRYKPQYLIEHDALGLSQSQAEAPRKEDDVVDSSQLEEYEAEGSTRNEEMKLLVEELDELQASRKVLLQKVADLEAIKIEAGTREEEIQLLRARTAEAEARKEAIQGILDDLAKEKEDLALEYDKNQRTLEKIESELNQLKAGDLDTTRNSEVDENVDEFFQDKIRSLEAQMFDQREEASGVIQQWEESYAALQAKNSEVEMKLQSSHVEIQGLTAGLNERGEITEKLRAELENALSNLTNEHGKVIELETLVQNISDQLADQERDANEVVAQWQESYDEVQTKLSELISAYEVLSSRLQETEAKLELAQQTSVSDDEMSELRKQNRSLEEMLSTQEQDASDTVQQWQEGYEALVMKLDDADIVRADLEANVKTLEEQLETHAEEARNVVMQWQDSYNTEATQCETMAAELRDTQIALEALRVQIGADDKKDTSEIPELLSTIQALHEQLKEHTDRIEELKAHSMNLQEQLNDQDKEASDVAAEWQRNYEEVCVERDKLKEEHDALLDEITRGNSMLAEFQAKYADASAQSDAMALEKKCLFTEKSQAHESLRMLRLNFELPQEAGSDDLSSAIIAFGDLLSLRWSEVRDYIAEWEMRYNEASALLVSKDKELEEITARTHLDTPKVIHDTQVKETLPVVHEQVESRQSEESGEYSITTQNTELMIDSLEKQLLEQKEDARNIVSQWQESYAALRKEADGRLADHQNLENEVNDLKRLIEEMKPVKERNEARLTELEAYVVELRDQLAANEDVARSVVSQWEAEYNTILSQLEMTQEENEELSLELHQSKNNPEIVVEQSIPEVKVDFDDANINRSKIAELSILLERSNQDRHAVESDLEATRNELEEMRNENVLSHVRMDDLQRRFEDSSESATRQLQSKVSALEKRISEHLEKAYRLECELDQARNDKTTLEEKLSRIQDDFGLQLDVLRSANNRMTQTMESQRLLNQELLQKMERDADTLRAVSLSLQRDYDQLQVRLAEKEDELLEANDALQLHSTNQVSIKATNVAANVLKEQILDLRAQVSDDRKTIAELRQICKSAEEEADRHRSDLAALLGMTDNEANRGAIDQRIMEATESFQRNERIEIISIKEALSRALLELAEARAAEKKVEERAANASHQAMLYEQEVVNAKSDFNFLSQTMEEMVESEAATRVSLEYRISSLQNEHIVLTRYHSTEMESLRNELNQVGMEKDRLFQALKESEKTKEVLIQAAKVPSIGENVDPLREMSRLRVEKVQLLSLAAEDATRAERRLRETRGAAKASADADIILERELRISAENSLESLVVEFAEFRDEMRKSGEHDSYSKLNWDESQRETAQLKAEAEVLAKECTTLRESLERTETKYKTTINQLETDCRLAKSRASQLEREGRYEAEVRAEVARIQASHVNGGERTIAFDENPADDDRENTIAIKMYDELEKQKEAFKEERLILFELQAERDDLLALLAQHDLLKDSLKSYLAQHGGQQAVDAAIEEAERKAKTQYGKCVRL